MNQNPVGFFFWVFLLLLFFLFNVLQLVHFHTDVYVFFGGFVFHIGAYIVWYKIPCVTQWVLESYFRDGYVRMLV